LQNYTVLERGDHLLRFGGQLRIAAESDQTTPNFNGTFVFPSLQTFQRTQQGLQQGLTPAQIRAAGGGAEQFSINTGTAAIADTMVSAGVFGLDNWKLRPNVTLSYGLRYETQNGIHDHTDFAPRFGLAWGIRPQGKTAPKNVLRLGYGIFYMRFAQGLLLNAQQLDGRRQQQFIVSNPDFFPNLPDANTLAASLAKPTIYQVDPSLRAPLLMQ